MDENEIQTKAVTMEDQQHPVKGERVYQTNKPEGRF